MGLIRARLLSFGMVLAIGFLLLVSLVASAALSALGKWWGGLFGAWETVLQLFNFIVSFAIITGMFAMIYKILPSVYSAQSFLLGAEFTWVYAHEHGSRAGEARPRTAAATPSQAVLPVAPMNEPLRREDFQDGGC